MRILWRSILSAVLLVTLAQAMPLRGGSDENGSAGLILLKSDENGYSLPANVRPTAYSIIVKPLFSDKYFILYGDMDINITVAEPATKTIVLHARDIDIYELSLIRVNMDGSSYVELKGQSVDAAKESLTIDFKNPITAGNYILHLEYDSRLTEDPRGFCLTSREIDGRIIWEASTDFRDSHARRAFPCFDDPAMKAQFTIDVYRPYGYRATSNVLAMKYTDDYRTRFETKALMSPDEIDFKVFYDETLLSTTYVSPLSTPSASPPTIPPANRKCIHASYVFMCNQCQPVVNIPVS